MTSMVSESLRDELVALRHELHQMPEVGLQVPQTTARLRTEFERLGMEIHDAQSVTGFAAVLRGGASPDPGPGRDAGSSVREGTRDERPLVLLRADMDGLPVQEQTGLDWASTNGAMHGCGHDLHMAGIVGAARILTERRDDLSGDVLFLLQPGEEGWDGAQHLIDEGLLEVAGRMPDHAYGLHVWSSLYPTGRITARPGPLMASSDTVEVIVRGRGGHGSAPHFALDPVPVAAELITQSHVMVTREFDVFDPVVVTCGSVQAGSAGNVIPDTATALFTVRAFLDVTRERVLTRLQQLFEGISAAHGMECQVTIKRLYPVTSNTDSEIELVAQTCTEVFPGRWEELGAPVGAAEDFSKILQRIPGAFVFLSAVPEGSDPQTAPFNHSPGAVYDDSVIPDCATLLAELALRRLT